MLVILIIDGGCVVHFLKSAKIKLDSLLYLLLQTKLLKIVKIIGK